MRCVICSAFSQMAAAELFPLQRVLPQKPATTKNMARADKR